MPIFLSPEDVRLELRDGAPVIILAVEMSDELVSAEWSVLNRLTLIVVDGPGDTGFLLSRLATGGEIAPAGWDDAFDRAAGSHVVFGTAAGAPATFARSAG